MALINHLNKIHLGYLNDLSLGKIEKIVSRDTEKMEGFLSHHQTDIVEILLMAPLILMYLIYVDTTLSIALIVPFIVAALVLGRSMAKPENKEDQVVLNDEMEHVQTEVIEYINGMNDIKCYDIGEKSMGEYKKAISGLSNIITKIAKVSKNVVGLFFAIINLPYLTVFLVVAFRYFNGFNPEILISEFIMFIIAITTLKSVLENIFVMSRSMTETNESVERIDSILEIPRVEEPEKSQKISNYDIEFKGVSFDYGSKKVLKDIDLKVPEGSKLGIVGSSGGGKTTIAKLIIKFLKAKSGKITIGGVDINDIGSEMLMKDISFVFQENYLFENTIQFNLTMDRDIPQEEVIRICKALNLHQKIMSLQKGYGTVVGKGEGFFSGGEIQRIAVARILLKKSKIIVLDEATASSDTENEMYLQKAFFQMGLEKTVIMIAHRLKTIEKADQIIVVEDGRIQETGDHEGLLAAKGRYYELFNYQNTSEKITISGREKGESLC